MADIWKKTPSVRPLRVAAEAAKVLTTICHREIRDPRIGSHISVLRVEASKDLRNMTVIFSSMDVSNEQNAQDMARIRELLAAFRSAKAFLAHRLGQEMQLKAIPELKFKFAEFNETSPERVKELLQQIAKKEG